MLFASSTSLIQIYKIYLKIESKHKACFIYSYQENHLVNIGADETFVLPIGFDQNFGPLPLFPAADMPPGNYEFSCRLLDPITKKLLAEDLNTFEVQ